MDKSEIKIVPVYSNTAGLAYEGSPRTINEDSEWRRNCWGTFLTSYICISHLLVSLFFKIYIPYFKNIYSNLLFQDVSKIILHIFYGIEKFSSEIRIYNFIVFLLLAFTIFIQLRSPLHRKTFLVLYLIASAYYSSVVYRLYSTDEFLTLLGSNKAVIQAAVVFFSTLWYPSAYFFKPDSCWAKFCLPFILLKKKPLYAIYA